MGLSKVAAPPVSLNLGRIRADAFHAFYHRQGSDTTLVGYTSTSYYLQLLVRSTSELFNTIPYLHT